MELHIIFIFSIAWIGYTCGNVIMGPMETVVGGQYIYYNLSSIDTYVHLQLETESGDCDLYVSEEDKYPTFDEYTLQSATCGIDSVLVRKKVKGPVYIGIYGHPGFDDSQCLLRVCLLDRPEEVDDWTDELTESNSLSDTIRDTCFADQQSSNSLVGRSLTSVARIIRQIEFDGILLELVTTLAQTLI